MPKSSLSDVSFANVLATTVDVYCGSTDRTGNTQVYVTLLYTK